MRRTSYSFAVYLPLVVLAAFASSCSRDHATPLTPRFALEGLGVGPDARGETDFEVDFGTVAVGRRHVPEVFVVNRGDATLEVRLTTRWLDGPSPWR